MYGYLNVQLPFYLPWFLLLAIDHFAGKERYIEQTQVKMNDRDPNPTAPGRGILLPSSYYFPSRLHSVAGIK